MPFWMVIAEWSARLVLILLIFLSIWSVSIMLDRKKFFKKLDTESKDQSGFFQRASQTIGQQKTAEAMERSFENFIETERSTMDKGLSVLGTLGGTAPFIGLLGTILGIIKAFGELSAGAMNTNKVMFALAEALILTAIGLAVAIPSVVAFNYFQKKIRKQIANVRIIKNNLLNQASR